MLSVSLLWQRWPWLVERLEVNLNLLITVHTPGDLEEKEWLVLDEAVEGQSLVSSNWVEKIDYLNKTTAKFECIAINMAWNE